VLEGKAPYKTVGTFANVFAEDGREMHKSWGNAIWFDDAVDKMGADAIRWMYASTSTWDNLLFGFGPAREIKRRFLQFWNVCSFFVLYANADTATGDGPKLSYRKIPSGKQAEGFGDLDRWLLARLSETVSSCTLALGVSRELERHVKSSTPSVEGMNIRGFVTSLEAFWEDLANWYVRRNRRRFWKGEADAAKQAGFETLFFTIHTLLRLMAPVVPFMTDFLWRRIVRAADPGAPESVHLAWMPVTAATGGTWPCPDPHAMPVDLFLLGRDDLARLAAEVPAAQRAVTLGLAARNAAKLGVRHPLRQITYYATEAVGEGIARFQDDVLGELNVREVAVRSHGELDLAEAADIVVKLNFKSVGTRLGARVQVAAKSLAAEAQRIGAAALLARSLDEGKMTIDASDGGEALALEATDLLFTLASKPGFAVAQDRDLVAVLDARIDDDLAAEGQVREVLRQVQVARKDRGLEVTDRIRLGLFTDTDLLRGALYTYSRLIEDEALAPEVSFGTLAESPAGATQIDEDGRRYALSIEKI